jgi:hypothetical protein
MNALVATGAVGAVFIFSVDRFARRTEDALRLAREYKRHGVRLDFVEMFYEDTPTGRFTFTQLAAFSELWGEKILADSARGRKQKLESGKLTHGEAKYGYIYIDKRQKDGARFEIEPEKAKGEAGLPLVRLRGHEHVRDCQAAERGRDSGGGSSRQATQFMEPHHHLPDASGQHPHG